MNYATPQAEAKALNAKLQAARYAYYVESNPIMSDPEYDALEKRLKELVDQNPNLKVARIPNGQNLDAENRAKVLALLIEYGFQTFIETVGSGELKALVLEEVG